MGQKTPEAVSGYRSVIRALRKKAEMEQTIEEKQQAVKDLDNARIAAEEARGYDYSAKPEHYSSWQWCGQCNRSLMSWDDETCDCMDWDEE